MTMPTGVAPRTVLSGTVVNQGDAVTPTAIIDPMSEAVHDVVDMLKRLILTTGAFHSEKDVDAAFETLTKWQKAQTKSSVLNALMQEHDPMAEKEDVTLRVAPNSTYPQAIAPQFDYRKLAAAILAIQAEQAAEAAGEVVPA